TPIVPAVHRNNAGIIGAAALALAGERPGVLDETTEDLADTTAN
ncbi:MAG: polyphosphate glucokinase, partial [Microbacterium sp.]|nr:polyphosphate glucokinase [Microbacterium sp.]